MPASAYQANLLAKELISENATVYLALTITEPSKTVPGTEVTAAEYARFEFHQGTDWDDDDAGSLTVNLDLDYSPITTEDYDDEVVAVQAYDDPTAGNALWYIVLVTPRLFVIGETPKFLTGDLVLDVV
jgi:hypothetical protein